MSDAERKEHTFRIMDGGGSRRTGTITVDDDGEIEIRWHCGDTRSLTREALETAMTQLRYVIGFDNAWISVPCLYDEAIAARVENGHLFVADDADEMLSDDQNLWADWAEFQLAVDEALREVARLRVSE
jgi:hypothetical protein